jgi:shikimate kinase
LVKEEGVDAWKRIYEQRRPVYEALADVKYDTSSRPLDAIATEIVHWLQDRES